MSSNADKYLTHSAGVYALLGWIEQQELRGNDFNVVNETIHLSTLGAKQFALGTSRHKKAKLPFLAMQPNETQWIKLIQWDYIALREKFNYLYLVSKVVEGDKLEFPDIPAFAIGIPFDMPEKLDLIQTAEKLDGREFFVESDDKILINYHQKIFSLKIKRFDSIEPYIENQKIVNYVDIMREKESYLQNTFSTLTPPVFQGEIGYIDDKDAKDLYKKMNDKNL